MLRRAGCIQDVLKLIADVVRECEVCRRWLRPPAKTRIRAQMASFFNDVVFVDLYFV